MILLTSLYMLILRIGMHTVEGSSSTYREMRKGVRRQERIQSRTPTSTTQCCLNTEGLEREAYR